MILYRHCVLLYCKGARKINITFYNNSSDTRKLNKSITRLASVDVKLKDNCSILRPRIILKRSTLTQYANCNYMYIPAFNRYYFAEISALVGDRVEITGNVDVLMSYANQIRALNVTVLRQEYMYNDYFIDNQLPIRQTKTIQFAKIGTYNAGTGLYLTVDGGSE